MRLLDTFSLATRMFKTRTLRTFLTVLGVSVGIGAVLFLVSLGYGLQNVILNQITTTDSLLSLDVTSASTDFLNLTKNDINEISQISEVTEVSSSISLSSQLSLGEFTGDGTVYAIEPSYFRLSGLVADLGNLFETNNEYSAVMSSAGAQLFGLEPDEIVGQEVSLTVFLNNKESDFEEYKIYERQDKYKIIGVIEDQNSNFVYIPQQTIADMNIDDFAQLKVKISDNQYMGVVRDRIVEKGFLVSSLSDTIDQANKIFQVVQIVLALFGLIALTVSAIGMFNTMTIALLERINEIGIMRAVGVTRSDIKKIFLLESVLMGFLGGVGGLAVGYIGGELANFGINMLAKNFGGQALDLFYQPLWFVFFIISFSTGIGLLTGVYPSMKASKLNPLAALRYK